jgi:hypothetical protein
MKTSVAIVMALLLAFCGGVDRASKPLVIPDIDGVSREPFNPGDSLANVLFFIRPDCPISNSYAPEITRLKSRYGPEKVNFYLVYTLRDLTPAAVRDHMKEYILTGPALIDRTHGLVKAAGATVTIEAAVIGREGKLIYRGRIDDLYAGLGKPRTVTTTHELRDALDALIQGKETVVTRTKAVGCTIADD